MGKKLSLAAALLPVLVLAAFNAAAAEPGCTNPFEARTWSHPTSSIDRCVPATLRKNGIEPAPLCSDEVFVRRAYLDVIGTLPEPAEVVAFLADPRADKRAALIDALLKRDLMIWMSALPVELPRGATALRELCCALPLFRKAHGQDRRRG